MTPNLKIWQPHFEEVEGRINHFYLDGDDNVTIGIGCMITAPTLLSWETSSHPLGLPQDFSMWRAESSPTVRGLPVSELFDALIHWLSCEYTLPILSARAGFPPNSSARTNRFALRISIIVRMFPFNRRGLINSSSEMLAFPLAQG